MTVEIHDKSNPDALPRQKCGNRAWLPAMLRGFAGKCPNCGKAPAFSSWLKIQNKCPLCGEELHHHRADDAPPYFTIFIVGHILLPLIYATEKLLRPELWVHFVLWLPLTVILTVLLLPRIKGAILGLQWALCMHGFEYSALCAPKKPRKPDQD